MGGLFVKSKNARHKETLDPPVYPAPVSCFDTREFPFNPPREFKLSDMRMATDDFNENNILGQGRFGIVYKGNLPMEDGQTINVAIKRLNPESHQGQQEWLVEILILWGISHSNLIKFYGYCSEEGEGILVYEYAPLGSLDYHLFSNTADSESVNDSSLSLPWEVRIKIAFGTASGLAFLHKNNIIHRDFKAPNILLNANFNPLLTDFGLAKISESDETHISTRIMGTLGYLDPRYMETGRLTKKSDVYSYGVLLLELISGRRAMSDGQSITSWASKFIHYRKPQIEKILDPSILPTISSKPMKKIAQKLVITARHCVEDDPQLRPQMSDIVDTLEPLVNNVLNGRSNN